MVCFPTVLLALLTIPLAEHRQQRSKDCPPDEADRKVLDQVGVEEKTGECGHKTRSHGAFHDPAGPPPCPARGAKGDQEEPQTD